MGDILLYLLLFSVLALVVVGGIWVMRSYLSGQSPSVSFFGQRAERRLAIVEHANVDGRRRLVLIRRDDVEHLIMTGGPVDVVIETGIGERKGRLEGAEAPAVFARAPRSFGQAAERTPERTTERAAE